MKKLNELVGGHYLATKKVVNKKPGFVSLSTLTSVEANLQLQLLFHSFWICSFSARGVASSIYRTVVDHLNSEEDTGSRFRSCNEFTI